MDFSDSDSGSDYDRSFDDDFHVPDWDRLQDRRDRELEAYREVAGWAPLPLGSVVTDEVGPSLLAPQPIPGIIPGPSSGVAPQPPRIQGGGVPSDNACVVWDITVPLTVMPDRDGLVALLKTYCAEWTFQREFYPTAPTLFHWQMRVNLNRAHRSRKPWNTVPIPGHWSVTSKGCWKDMSRYVSKLDTRAEGPWSHKDADMSAEAFPDDWMEGLETPFDFQESLLASFASPANGREINCLIDPVTSIGKSAVYKFATQRIGYVERFHLSTSERELMLDVASTMGAYPSHILLHKRFVFIIDIPYALTKLPPYLWSSIESLLGCEVKETRYSSKKIRFMKPHVWVFCNHVPDLSKLSPNRWKLWEVRDNKLVRYEKKN